MNTFGLRSALEEDVKFAIEYITNLSPKVREDALMVINEDFFQHMHTHKQEFEQRSPSKDVDLEFEQEVILKGKEALNKEKPRKKTQFLCPFQTNIIGKSAANHQVGGCDVYTPMCAACTLK